MRNLLAPIALAACAGNLEAPTPPRGSSAAFETALHARLPAGNLAYSPASIAIALAMTREGARGTTAGELDAVLGAQAGTRAQQLVRDLRGDGDDDAPVLAIANRLYGSHTVAFEPGFVAVTRDGYRAPIEGVDFGGEPEAARSKINAWVAEQTRDKITDLLPRGTIAGDTALVLVNAIYLKAQWQTLFRPSETRDTAFAVDGAAKRQVPTMHGLVTARIGTRGAAHVIDLPYRAARGGPQLAMLVVVPDDRATLADVERAYATGGIAPFLGALGASRDVDLAMPKFRVRSDFALANTLQQMGITTAFTASADFTGISKTTALHIQHVVHQAYVDVDEVGTEAAAATAITMGESAYIVDDVARFAVDRSFVFAIHDAAGTVLFAGRVVDPASSR